MLFLACSIIRHNDLIKQTRVCTPCSYFSKTFFKLEKGRVVIFAAGTGNPFFTTDSAASLRAIEINAELMIKATKVKGIYSADPEKVPEAKFYSRLTYDEALDQRLNVMDTTALVLCRDNDLPMRVMNIFETGAVMRLMQGEEIGSLIERGN
jgi:uridylate kinase